MLNCLYVDQPVQQDTISSGTNSKLFNKCNSSAVDMVIPAEGKAIVPTDISIAVPEGITIADLRLNYQRNLWESCSTFWIGCKTSY